MAERLIIDLKRTVSLDCTIKPESLTGTLCGGEKQAHRFIIRAIKGGAAVTLSGTVTAECIRWSDGETVPLTGAIEDGAATVTLDESCYLYEGGIRLTVYLTTGGSKISIYTCDANVRQASTGTYSVPGQIVSSFDEMIQQMETVRASIPTEYSALSAQVDEMGKQITDDLYLHETDTDAFYWRPKVRVNSAGAYATNQAHYTGIYADSSQNLLHVYPGSTVMANAGYVMDYSIKSESGTTLEKQQGIAAETVVEISHYGILRLSVTDTEGTADTSTAESAAAVAKAGLTIDLVVEPIKDTVARNATDIAELQSAVSADAAAVAELTNAIYIHDEITPELEQGSITTSNGQNSVADNRVRTGFYTYAAPVSVTIGSAYKYSWRRYQADGTYIDSSDWIPESSTLEFAVGQRFRLVIANQESGAITPSDVTELSLSMDAITDTLLTKPGKAADAKATGDMIRQIARYEHSVSPTNALVGNISIRAAKTINFSDGTPPMHEWYLLQSVGDAFYRSKDLSSKEYLFTFTPPSGNVADWSAGITASNDVLFVADAAGLSTTVNGRLSDDNRVNPVIFLASENYATMHTIDFGSALKPCGWLENVGFCLLPGGDIVMCEYTRGTVKTANVWRVSGDVTDAANWTATWSHDIIDAMDTTTAGIKHCHEVQYDFYTGIVYFGTGDSSTGSMSYYSTDGGATWTLLYGPDKDRCRRLTYVFTKNYVYWASDSYQSENHHFFIAQRDSNGIIDIGNATQIALPSTNDQACYGCVYLQALNAVVMMDRIDNNGGSTFNWYCYDIDAQAVKLIGTINAVGSVTNAHLGFRCKFVDWYPRSNAIMTGFNPRSGSANPDTNVNALCGNGGGVTGTGETRINNLILHTYKSGAEYSYRAETLWI